MEQAPQGSQGPEEQSKYEIGDEAIHRNTTTYGDRVVIRRILANKGCDTVYEVMPINDHGGQIGPPFDAPESELHYARPNMF